MTISQDSSVLFVAGKTLKGDGVQVLAVEFKSDLPTLCSLVVTGPPGTACLTNISNTILALGFAKSVHVLVFDGQKISVKESIDLEIEAPIFELLALKGEVLWSEQKGSKVGRIVWPGGLRL